MSRRTRRVLVVATYPERAACTRFRASVYFPLLRERGIEETFLPFLDDAFFARFYEPGRAVAKARGLMEAAARRLALLARVRRFDAIFVQREAALVGPALFEELATRGLGVPLVYDFDDALWINDPAVSPGMASRHPLAARLLKFPEKTDRLITMASEVLAGSGHLAEHARALNPRVTVVPTVVSRERWVPLPGKLEGQTAGVPVIGWVGTHTTALQLDMVIPALRRLAAEGERFSLRLVGASRPEIQIEGIEVDHRPWRLERDVRDFQELDIGLAPMFSDPWSEGKCAFKQLQYMAVGVPMVTSLVGGGRDFLRHDDNALVAHEPGDWYGHLKSLLHDAERRGRLARAGRTLVEQTHCTEVQGPRVIDAIERAMSGQRTT
jgi:glycosyltransferase involved in cell wall biosynthesis